MKNDSRVAVGLLMIILGCVAFYFMYQASSHSPTEESASDQWATIVVTLWLIISSTVKLMMVMGKRANWVNISSGVSFIIAGIVLWSLPGHSQTIVHFNPSLVFFSLLFLSSWFTVDILDIKWPKQTT